MITENSQEHKIEEALTKQIDKIYPNREALEKILKSREKLTIYWGIDPTASSLHIAHSANLFILRRFQKLGHKIIILIGDFTARIGDPTGKHKKRVPLAERQVIKNLKHYKSQILKILDSQKTVFRFNSEWWKKMSAEFLLDLCGLITHQRLIERDMFQKRIKAGESITEKEVIYPLLQGYDSVVLKTDAELGGSDQLFNMLVGRDLEKSILKKEKFVITKPIITHPKTGEMLMSKTTGGAIFISEPADQMYGKIMALADEVIIECFKLCTDVDDNKVRNVELRLKSGENPRNLKSELAFEIVKIYHGEKKAKEAAEEFERVFKKHELPENIREISITMKPRKLIELLMQMGLASSRSESRRKVLENAVKVDGKIKKDPEEVIDAYEGMVVQYGKRNFRKIKKN
ncbi:MAG: tyrosine--tRNA ligase [Parcubacteria group bacterium]|nr:tyrosine--tRNA ligase [Parcubacteria group bacterium]